MSTSRIHVYCRVRSIEDSDGIVKSYPPAEEDENYVALTVLDRSSLFSVDKFFDKHSQEDIFQDSLEPLIEETFSGINCTVFTYGQTGSGKTHTIIGGQDPDNRGLLPRAVDSIFQRIQSLRDSIDEDAKKPEFTVKVSILEIYHEKLRDLLSSNKQEQNLAIREKSDGTIWVENLSDQIIQGSAEYARLLQQALKRRVIGSHKMNDQSSRSHLCCLIHLTHVDKVKGKTLQSNISLIDLAGSEMAKKTEASGQRFEEAKFINKSLSALSKVIHALSMQQHFESTSAMGAITSIKISSAQSVPSHIPYRDSKLTRLLQHSLSGNAKTVIFLTISNAMAHAAETISTLKFGDRARLVVTKPRINVGDSLSIEPPMFYKAKMAGYENEISEYQRIIEQLQSQVVSMQSVIEDLQSENANIRQSTLNPSHANASALCCQCNASSSIATNSAEKNSLLSDISTPVRSYNNKDVSGSDQRPKKSIVNLTDDSDTSEQKTTDAVPVEVENDPGDDEGDEDDDEYNDRCGICGMNQEESDRLQDTTGENLGFFFHCDGNCGSMFHIRCVGLIGDAGQYILPEGEWFCLSCQHDLEMGNCRECDPHEEIASAASIDASSINQQQQQQPKPEALPPADVLHSLKSEFNSSRESPLKAALSMTQHELQMARLWQQQYDVIRKDRNRILLQWQQDQESFRMYQQQRLQLQEERENVVLHLEEKQLELTASLTRQQEENLTLKSCLKDLQDRYTQMQQQSSASPFYSSMALSSSIDEDTDIKSPSAHQEQGKRFHRYDAAYAFDEAEMDANEARGTMENVENVVLGNEMTKLPTPTESMSATAKSPGNSPSKRQGKASSSLPPAHGGSKTAQRKASVDKGTGQKPPLSLSSTMPASTRAIDSNSKVPKRSLPDISAPQSSGGPTLIRSASDRVPSEDSDNSTTSASGITVSSAPAGSRFVNPLRNRLSELIAQADEEKESFVDLRMKLQSRAEIRGSREGLR